MPSTIAPAVGSVLDCGHVLPAVEGIGAGYARDRNEHTMCYPCAEDAERAAFLVAGMTGKPFTAYVSDAGDLTTWTGAVLATAVPNTHGVSRSGWHGSEVHSWRFRTGDAVWHGRNGGPGMSITARRAKH